MYCLCNYIDTRVSICIDAYNVPTYNHGTYSG